MISNACYNITQTSIPKNITVLVYQGSYKLFDITSPLSCGGMARRTKNNVELDKFTGTIRGVFTCNDLKAGVHCYNSTTTVNFKKIGRIIKLLSMTTTDGENYRVIDKIGFQNGGTGSCVEARFVTKKIV